MSRFAHVSPQHLSIVGDPEFAHLHVDGWMMRTPFDMKSPTQFSDSFQANAYGFRELTLAEMLGDPIVRDLMRSDRVSASDIKRIFSGRGNSNFAYAA